MHVGISDDISRTLAENRARHELENLGVRVVNRHAQHVAGQHVAGELQAVEAACGGARQGLRQGGLTDTGDVFDQQVSAREEADQRLGLVVTAAGCAAIGIDLNDVEAIQQSIEDASPPATALLVHTEHETATPRPASKRAAVIALLARPDGATLAELCDQTGWLAHSARAFLTGLRKGGHRVERSRSDGVTRYAITEAADAER